MRQTGHPPTLITSGGRIIVVEVTGWGGCEIVPYEVGANPTGGALG